MEPIQFTWEIQPDDTPIEDNVLASGNDAADRGAEQEIRRRVMCGKTHAWCAIFVRGRSGEYIAHDCLGGVSVLQEREIITNPDYLRLVVLRVAEQICERAFDAGETLPETPDEATDRFVSSQ